MKDNNETIGLENTGSDENAKINSNLAVRFDKNPFLAAQAEYKTSVKRTVIKGGKAVIDVETGTYENTAEIVQTHQVDAEKFVKLYTRELHLMFSLTASSMRVLQVVLKQVQEHVGQDQILLNLKIAEQYFLDTDQKAMSKATFYRAINEMIAKGFLAPAAVSRDVFFINPNLFFNGDRVKLVKEYQIIRPEPAITKSVVATKTHKIAQGESE
jgi:hypothetical protein